MNCEKCGSDRHRVIETRAGQGNVLRRRRTCRLCGHDWSTTERISVYEDGDWQDQTELVVAKPAKVARVAKTPKLANSTKFWPITPELVEADLQPLPPELRILVFRWWNESRRSRHGTKATWTQGAWRLSINRVVQLVQAGQRRLAQQLAEEGAEAGWMALKPEYIQPVNSTPVKPDPFMQSAGESWDTAA